MTFPTDVPLSSPGSARPASGWWRPDKAAPTTDPAAVRALLGNLRTGVVVVRTPEGAAAAAPGGVVQLGGDPPPGALPLLAMAPRLPPGVLGDPAFRAAYGVNYAYMTGAMANGIASAELVEAVGRAGMLGSFGAAGLSIDSVTKAIDRLQAALADRPFCINLIHSPNDPAHEAAVVDLLLRRGVTCIEASAYLDLTPPVVRYRVSGVTRGPMGEAVPQNRVIAKVSRTEVAAKFLSPPPARMLAELLAAGQISAHEAELAAGLPMCDDLTAEADSGGHTDNRPAITLLPTLIAQRDRLQAEFDFPRRVRVGLAGGVATPAGVAAAFAMGAAYVVTGSVNQACVESGSSDLVRGMLAAAGQADVAMAPAADMFEMGVKVQVLKRGTMFPMRAQKLYDLYRMYPAWEAIPEADRVQVEKTFLRATFDAAWADTRAFFARRDPSQLPRADADPRHRMALVFRSYLGLSSRWANAGDATRQLDYQVWCGPAMGAFNEWAKGSSLEPPAGRTAAGVARQLLYGACVALRRQGLRQQGSTLPDNYFPAGPVPDAVIHAEFGVRNAD